MKERSFSDHIISLHFNPTDKPRNIKTVVAKKRTASTGSGGGFYIDPSAVFAVSSRGKNERTK